MTNYSNPGDFQVDLTNCDREPIHLLGRIQDVGFLVAVSSDWLIERVSLNIGRFVDRDAGNLPGEPLTFLFPENTIHSIRGRLQILSSNEGMERLFRNDLFGDGRLFDVAVHLSDKSIVIEAEPSSVEEGVNQGALLKTMIARVQKTADLDALFRESVRQLRGITGFDRVMLYRFNDKDSGAVIAESARSGIGSFLGLNYPASDIPAQARALYIRNQIRIISDVGGVPVPVEPALDPHGEPLDLSLSTLRSVSPIHIEYLANMGVSASMSVSIVIDGRLWGLFALHHYAPRHLPMELRSAIELFGQMLSLIVEGRLAKEERRAEEVARKLHDQFVSRIIATTRSVESLADFADELREIIACDGFAVWAKGKASIFGNCPGVDELVELAKFLNRAGASRVYATSELSKVFPPAAEFDGDLAGVLAVPISRSPRDYILFFRREIVKTVSWAGDPHTKERSVGPNGLRLTPRKSFETWQEDVRGHSQPWSDADRRAAEALRVSILEVLLRFNEESERQQTLANQRQELLIAELNHRVRNILGLIRGLVAQSKPGAKDVDDLARIIGGRVQALARAHDQITSENFHPVALRDIIQTEVSAYIGEKAARVIVQGPEVKIEVSAFSTLALVFHEMVTNSAKYGALSDSSGSVTVDWTVEADGTCRIEWAERGGPAVMAPTRRGFGSTIIERSIPHDLGGEARLDYKLAGLEATFVLPARVFHLDRTAVRHEGPTSAALPRTTPAMKPGSLSGVRGLIVEDNMIISLDAEQLMIDNGMSEVFVAASVGEARKVIERETLDVAMLDVNLGRETSFPLVRDLNARQIPFFFVTGYGEQIEFPAEIQGARAIKKPFASDQLLGALSEAIAKRAGERSS